MASIYKRGKTWTANVFVTIDGTRKEKLNPVLQQRPKLTNGLLMLNTKKSTIF